MRRKGSRASEYSIVPHTIEDVGRGRLKTIGAISLTWNSIEGAVDTALGLALEQPEPSFARSQSCSRRRSMLIQISSSTRP
jgi:hypothetical protein